MVLMVNYIGTRRSILFLHSYLLTMKIQIEFYGISLLHTQFPYKGKFDVFEIILFHLILTEDHI